MLIVYDIRSDTVNEAKNYFAEMQGTSTLCIKSQLKLSFSFQLLLAINRRAGDGG